MKSLEKGNQHPMKFLKDGREEKMPIEANPQFKTQNLYDSSKREDENAQNENLNPPLKINPSVGE